MPYPKRPRTWWNKFREAVTGMLYGFRHEKSFRFQVPTATACVLLGIYLKLESWEWCAVTLSIGLVLTAEMVNTAIEAVFHGLEEETRSRWNPCLDIAAGAVLVAGIAAITIGIIIFGKHLSNL
ncbi:diacylglycerol kinase [Telmatocola sphagniphila]|uniref:Diacylglycerol kinase n=1 Tax=Telmatocola sphagniphila TaxID=1123043 RepID=A0A8E6ETA3_9BACT|nr:diacylglycerol kinase [Telmatocola sphagniphila]QVL32194.1 diacylglycerol kinase [Telmatocola sphagniphila]